MVGIVGGNYASKDGISCTTEPVTSQLNTIFNEAKDVDKKSHTHDVKGLQQVPHPELAAWNDILLFMHTSFTTGQQNLRTTGTIWAQILRTRWNLGKERDVATKL